MTAEGEVPTGQYAVILTIVADNEEQLANAVQKTSAVAAGMILEGLGANIAAGKVVTKPDGTTGVSGRL